MFTIDTDLDPQAFIQSRIGLAHAKGEPWAELVTVTPDLASHFLGHMAPNRHVRARKVTEYAEALRNGRWKVNGETFVVDTHGRLADAQHRCKAIVEADIPMRTFIVWGVDPSEEIQPTIGTGTKRSAGDALNGQGEQNSTQLAAAIGWTSLLLKHRYEGAPINQASMALRSMPNLEIIEFLRAHPRLRDCLPYAKNVYRGVGGSLAMWVGLFYLFSEIDENDAVDFFDQLASGVNLKPGDPAYVLREKLRRRQDPNIRVLPAYTAAIAVKAWNAYRQGRSVQKYQWTMGSEPFPTAL